MRRACVTLTAVVCLWGTVLGETPDPSSVEVIKSRIANFRKIGAAFKGIRDQLRTSEPTLPEIQKFAARIASLGSQIPAWFPTGTGAAAQSESGNSVSHPTSSDDSGNDAGKTRAKSEIWTERGEFEGAHKRFLAEAQKMVEIAKSGNKSALATQYKVLGAACKNCHNTFRD